MANPHRKLQQYAAGHGKLNKRIATAGKEIAFDMSQFGKGMADVLQLLAKAGVDGEAFFVQIVQKLFKQIVQDTPVDTGFARSSWKIERIQDDKGLRFKISNTAPYIIYLEFGSSQKAPNGMVRVNLVKFEKDLKTLAGRLTP